MSVTSYLPRSVNGTDGGIPLGVIRIVGYERGNGGDDR